MSYHVGLPLPRTVQRGVATLLTCPVFDDPGEEYTASGGTITITVGSSVIVDAVAIDNAGPPADYTISAAATADLNLSDQWLEVWNLTGLDIFRVSGHLVRHAWHDRLTDSVLQDVHPEFATAGHLPPGEVDGSKFRRAASQRIERRLLAKGRRPFLIFEPTALLDPQIFLTLHLWAEDTALRSNGATEWIRLSERYLKRYEDAWGQISFSYDENEDGVPTEGEEGTAAQSGSITLTAGNPGAWRRGWR